MLVRVYKPHNYNVIDRTSRARSSARPVFGKGRTAKTPTGPRSAIPRLHAVHRAVNESLRSKVDVMIHFLIYKISGCSRVIGRKDQRIRICCIVSNTCIGCMPGKFHDKAVSIVDFKRESGVG